MGNASYESVRDTLIKARLELHHLREGGSERLRARTALWRKFIASFY